jgi:hypothetical protein
MPRPICFSFETQLMDQAFCFARDNAGKSKLARMAIMAMTTNNSINVKARCVYTIPLDARQARLLQFGLARPSSVSSRLLLRDAVEELAPAQEQFPAGGGRGGLELLVEMVGGQHLQLVGLLEHYGHAISAREINSAGCAKR